MRPPPPSKHLSLSVLTRADVLFPMSTNINTAVEAILENLPTASTTLPVAGAEEGS